MMCSSCAHREKKLLQCSLTYKPGNLFWNEHPMRKSQLSCTNGPSSSAFCLLQWQRMCCLERACKFGSFLASHSPCTFLVSRTVAFSNVRWHYLWTCFTKGPNYCTVDLVNSSSALTSCLHNFGDFSLLLSKLKSSCLSSSLRKGGCSNAWIIVISFLCDFS